MNQEPSPPIPTHPWRWFPEFWELGRRRLRTQARLMGLSLIVGIIAGLGAIVFHFTCQTVAYGALDVAAGYHPIHPQGESGVIQGSFRDPRVRSCAIDSNPFVGRWIGATA